MTGLDDCVGIILLIERLLVVVAKVLLFSVKSKFAVCAHRIAVKSADKAALYNSHWHLGIRQRRDSQQFVWCKLKADVQLLMSNDRRVVCPLVTLPKYLRLRPHNSPSFLKAEIAASAQLNDGHGYVL